MEKSSFIFILEQTDNEENIELVKDKYYLNIPSEPKLILIKNYLEKFEGIAHNNYSTKYENDIIPEFEKGKTTYKHIPLEKTKWKYRIIETNETDFEDYFGKMLYFLKKPIHNVITFHLINECKGHFAMLDIEHINSLLINEVGYAFNDDLKYHIDQEMLDDLQKQYLIFSKIDNLDNINPDITKAINDYIYLQKNIPKKNPFHFLGLISILELILVHKRKGIDDGLSQQFVNKIIFVNNQHEKISFSDFFGQNPNTITENKILELLYSYRSNIAHGTEINFSKRLQHIKNHDKSLQFIDNIVRSIIKYSIKNPSLIKDLKRC